MANVNSILQQATVQGGQTNKPLTGKGLQPKDIIALTKRVSEFRKELNQAYSKGNAQQIQAVYKAMAQTKELTQARAKLIGLKKAMKDVTDSNMSQKKKIVALSELSAKIVETEASATKLYVALKKSSETPFDKSIGKIKEKLTSGTAQFISAGAAAGFFGNALYQIDKSAVYAQESIKQLPMSEAAKQFDEVSTSSRKSGEAVDGLTDGIVNFYDRMKESAGIRVVNKQQYVEAEKLQAQLRSMVLDTGKSMEELGETTMQVMSTFRLQVGSSRKEIADTVLDVENFGQTLGVGTAEALERVRMRTQDMGTSLEQARFEMAGTAKTIDNLRGSVEGLTISNKQYTDLLYDTVDADVRSSQNIRVKNQLISNTIEMMKLQGKTQKEATETAKDVVAAAMKGSESVENEAGMGMARMMNKAIKGGAEAKAAYLKMATEGMGEKEGADKRKQLERIMELNKNGTMNQMSLGKMLRENLGSQISGQKALMEVQGKRYNQADRALAADLMVQQGEVKTFDAAMIRLQQIEDFKNGKLQFPPIIKEEDLKNLDEVRKKAIVNEDAAPWIERTIKAGKELINNPAISAALGLVSSAGLLAAIGANVAALSLNTAALGGKSLMGGAGDLLKGGLGKVGGLATKIGGGLASAGTAALPWLGGAALAGGVGYGVGSAVDWADSKVDKATGGYSMGSGIQKGMSGVAGWFGGDKIVSDEDAFAMAEAKMKNRKRNVVTPSVQTPQTVMPAGPGSSGTPSPSGDSGSSSGSSITAPITMGPDGVARMSVMLDLNVPGMPQLINQNNMHNQSKK